MCENKEDGIKEAKPLDPPPPEVRRVIPWRAQNRGSLHKALTSQLRAKVLYQNQRHEGYYKCDVVSYQLLPHWGPRTLAAKPVSSFQSKRKGLRIQTLTPEPKWCPLGLCRSTSGSASQQAPPSCLYIPISFLDPCS